MRRFRQSLVYLLLFAMLLTSCRPNLQRDPNILKLWLSAEPDTLNQILASDAYAGYIHGFISESLIDRDYDTLEFKPKLAHRWEESANHLVYTFYLRQDVTWHDGVPFTADDVIYSFERIMDPKVQAPALRVYYARIESVKKLDPFTVRFTFKEPYFLALDMSGSIPILPRHSYETGGSFDEHPLNRRPLGTGPYQLTEWQTNKKLIMKRFEPYWGEKPSIKQVEFIIIKDDAAALQTLKKQELDSAGLRPIQWIKQTNSEKFNNNFQKLKYVSPGYNYIGWNNQSPFFSDKRVRRAMTHLVNREQLLQKLNYNLGRILTGPFFPLGKQYNQNVLPLEYAPARAQALLAEAGWVDHDGDGILDKDGKKFSFTFLYPSSATFTERMATIFQEELKRVGIEMTIKQLEWAVFLGKLDKKEFDATSLGWRTGFEGDPYQIWHSSQADIEHSSNFVAFKNAEADALIETARVEFDEAKRNALYHRLHELIDAEQPYTFLYANDSLTAVSKRIENVMVHKAGLDQMEWRFRPEL